MNKESVLITPDVIEECLCESIEKIIIPMHKKNAQSQSKNQKPLK